MTFVCKTHLVSLSINGNDRVYNMGPGSLGNFPRCALLVMLAKDPKEGIYRVPGNKCDCVIERGD